MLLVIISVLWFRVFGKFIVLVIFYSVLLFVCVVGIGIGGWLCSLY